MSELPVELFREILNWVSRNPIDLLNVSLVSRSWWIEARPLLYRDVRVCDLTRSDRLSDVADFDGYMPFPSIRLSSSYFLSLCQGGFGPTVRRLYINTVLIANAPNVRIALEHTVKLIELHINVRPHVVHRAAPFSAYMPFPPPFHLQSLCTNLYDDGEGQGSFRRFLRDGLPSLRTLFYFGRTFHEPDDFFQGLNRKVTSLRTNNPRFAMVILRSGIIRHLSFVAMEYRWSIVHSFSGVATSFPSVVSLQVQWLKNAMSLDLLFPNLEYLEGINASNFFVGYMGNN